MRAVRAAAAAVAAAASVSLVAAQCDPASDSYCATVKVFLDDAACSGTPAYEVAVPVNTGEAPQVECTTKDSNTDLRVYLEMGCFGSECVQGFIAGEPGACTSVSAENREGVTAVVDYDCRKTGICEPGDPDCAVVEIYDSCADVKDDAEPQLGFISDGMCYRSRGGTYQSAGCRADGGLLVRASCDAECKDCGEIVELGAKDQCVELDSSTSAVMRTECVVEPACDPASDSYCATVKVFLDDAACSGTPAYEVAVPVNTGEAPQVECTTKDSNTDLRVYLAMGCFGSECVQGFVAGEPGACTSVSAENREGVTAVVDYDCRKTGICEPGDPDCAVVEIYDSCADVKDDAEPQLGFISDGMCYRSRGGTYQSAGCRADGGLLVRASCDAECKECGEIVELGAKDQCVELDSSTSAVMRTECVVEPACDPASDSYCATVKVFLDDAACSGTPAYEVAVPVNTGEAPQVECTTKDSNTDLRVYLAMGCFGSECVQGFVAGEPGACTSVSAENREGVTAVVDYDCRKTGICEPGDPDCAVVEIYDSCADVKDDAEPQLGFISDGMCYRSRDGTYQSAGCRADGGLLVRASCDAECKDCGEIVELGAKDQCVELDSSTSAVMRTECNSSAATPNPPSSGPSPSSAQKALRATPLGLAFLSMAGFFHE